MSREVYSNELWMIIYQKSSPWEPPPSWEWWHPSPSWEREWCCPSPGETEWDREWGCPSPGET